MAHLRHQEPLCFYHLEQTQVTRPWGPAARFPQRGPDVTQHIHVANTIFSLFLSLLLLLKQPSVSVLQVFAVFIIFLSVLSIPSFIPSTVPTHTSTSPPTPQVLAQASVTGSNRLGQLKPPSPPCVSVRLRSSGLYLVNKLAQFPPILMRTQSHDSYFPTLKFSSLRDQFHYLFHTRVNGTRTETCRVCTNSFHKQFVFLPVPRSSFALSWGLFWGKRRNNEGKLQILLCKSRQKEK